jgi:signal transduction histidine kinase
MRIRPLAVDVLVAAALASVAVLLGQDAVHQGHDRLGAVAYALVVLVHLPLVFRGRAPVVVCCLMHATWLVYITAGYWPVVCSFGPMLAVYTVASLRSPRIAVPCAALMGATWIYAGAVSHTDGWPSVVGQALIYPAVLWRFGEIARRSAELTRQLRREQAERARREVAEERGRIARELHDVVAHHISVISVQTGLARFVFASDPRTARGAIETIDASAKEALDELRRMLMVLRSDDEGAPAGPVPGLGRLEHMAQRLRTGGIAVALTVEGTPRPLTPGVELCAYRVVQEALTNVVKHASGASAEIRLVYEAHQVTVSVTDDGQGVILDRVRADGGHGLLGIQERAKLYGGQVSVGPQEQGGFAVRVTLPTAARTAEQGDDTTT